MKKIILLLLILSSCAKEEQKPLVEVYIKGVKQPLKIVMVYIGSSEFIISSEVADTVISIDYYETSSFRVEKKARISKMVRDRKITTAVVHNEVYGEYLDKGGLSLSNGVINGESAVKNGSKVKFLNFKQ
jgi:hypothetical protein